MVATRKNKGSKAAKIDAPSKSVVSPKILKENPKSASDTVPTGKLSSDVVEKTTVLKNPKALVPEKKKSDKAMKETETVVQAKEKKIPKSIPEQISKKATALKPALAKEPAKKSTQEVLSNISKSVNASSPCIPGVSAVGSVVVGEKPGVVAGVLGKISPVVKGTRVKMVACKKTPVKDKFKIVKRKVVVSESDEEGSEEKDGVAGVEEVGDDDHHDESSVEEKEVSQDKQSIASAENSGEDVPEAAESSSAEVPAEPAKEDAEVSVDEEQEASQKESDKVDDSLQSLFDAVEQYVEEEFTSRVAEEGEINQPDRVVEEEELEEQSKESGDDSLKLSDLIKEVQKDVPASKEQVAKPKPVAKTKAAVSKKKKVPIPSVVEETNKVEASGLEKAASPVAKKSKTSSPTGKVKDKGKKVQFVSGVVKDGVWFVSEEQADKWKFVQKRKIVAERVLEADKYAAKEIVGLVKEVDLWPSVSMAKPFSANLVREVIANLPEGFADIESASFGMSSVRGKTVIITPEGINDYFGIEAGSLNIGENPNWHKIAVALTGGVSSKWFTMTFPVKELSSKHSLLHSIAVHNWLPNNHHTTLGHTMGAFLKTLGAGKKIDLGRLIFDQIASHASSVKVNHPIGFPSLIHQLVVGQHPDILTSQDKLTGDPKVFLADHKHFSGSHIVDLDLDAPIKSKKKLSGLSLDESSAHVPAVSRKRMITHLEEELADANERMVLLMARKKKITKLLVSLRYPEEEDDGLSACDEASDEESDY